MKIIHLASEYPPQKVFGLGRFVHDIAVEMARQGHEIHVITNSINGKDFEIQNNGVYIHRVHFPPPPKPADTTTTVLQFNLQLVERAVPLIRNLKADIINTHDWLTFLAGRSLNRIFGIPHILTIHDTMIGKNFGKLDNPGKLAAHIERYGCMDADAIICCSEFIKNELKNLYQAPNKKICVIPCGVNEENFAVSEDPFLQKSFRSVLALPHEVIISYVGRLDKEKGLDVLLNAIPEVIQMHHDIKFIIAGKGEMEESIRTWVKQNNLTKQVQLVGYISGQILSYLYKVTDIHIVPSTYEPFGIVALEGMINKCAVIVSNVGGLSEIVLNEVDGIKCSVANSYILASAIITLVNNPKYRDKLRIAGYEKAKNFYNWKRIAQITLDIMYKTCQMKMEAQEKYISQISINKKMKVGIDVRVIDRHIRGIGYYVERLVYYLAKSDQCNLILFGNRECQNILRNSIPEIENIGYKEIPFGLGDMRWENEEAGKLCDASGIDIYHGPSFTVATSGKVAKIITIHDVTFWLYPQFYDLAFIDHIEKSVRDSVSHANAILVDSQSTEEDLKKFVEIKNTPIRITWLGTEDFDFASTDQLKALSQEYDLKKYVILVIGMGQGRKNLSGILKGFSLLNQEIRQTTSLLIVGENWNVNPRAYQEAIFLGIEKNIVITGEISRKKLGNIYRLSNVVCYPSFHEGFGLPIIEAMIVGVPVITSNLNAMKEIAGESAYLVNPKVPYSICKALTEILTNVDIAQTLSTKGKKQAQNFTWQKTALETLRGYELALNHQRNNNHPIEISKHIGTLKKQLNIGIDARFYGMASTGIGRYTTEIIHALVENNNHHYYLFGPPTQPKFSQENIHSIFEGQGSILDSNWEQQTVPQLLIENKIDVYFSPTGFCPIETTIPCIIVVHDIGFEFFPTFYSRKLLKHLKEWLPKSCQTATHIISVSRFTQRDLILTYNISPDKTSVGYLGIDHIFSSLKESQNIYPFPYLLALSSGGLNKNLKGIVESFILMLKKFPYLPHHLILAGTVTEDIRKCCESSEFISRIKITGVIPDHELFALMKNASCLVHLSYFEGFGLPVAEAMGLGIPIVISDRGSLPEIVGESGLDVSPDDYEECSIAIARILQSPELATLLSQEGRKRSKEFRWSKSAKHIIEKIEKIMDSIENKSKIEILKDRISFIDKKMKVGLVTTWKIDCGIALYSCNLAQALVENNIDVVVLAEKVPQGEKLPDKVTVCTCWQRGESLNLLFQEIVKQNITIVNIQHHSAFFSDGALAELIWQLKTNGISTIVTFHEIMPDIPQAIFLAADKILVHTLLGKETLHRMGIQSRIDVIPIGIQTYPDTISIKKKISKNRPMILSHGFLQPSKGFHFMIEALSLLKNDFPTLIYRIIGSPRLGAEDYPQQLREKAIQNGVGTMVEVKEKFLTEEELLYEILNADIVVYPYQHHIIGSSAAVTPALAMGATIITSATPYFEDLGDSILRASSIQELANAVKICLIDDKLANSLGERAKDLAKKRSWHNIAFQHKELYESILKQDNENHVKQIKPWISVHIISKETDSLGMHFFKSCLEVLRGYPDEVIVIDNGSSPDVLEMVKKELEHFHAKLILKPDITNYSDLRNIALAETNENATHIHWIDTDEIFFPEQLMLLKKAMKDPEIAMFQTTLVHFMIAPDILQNRQLKRNVFRYNKQMRWSRSVHEIMENMTPGRKAFIPIEHLHFGYCRPQWQTFLKWIRYAILEYKNADMYRSEMIEGIKVPWLRETRTPDTILDERLPKLQPYRGNYPQSCLSWLEPWKKSGIPWKEYLYKLVDHNFWIWWQKTKSEIGTWQETLPIVIEKMGWKENWE